MRQFSVYQQTPVPILHSVEPHVHRYGIYNSVNNSSYFYKVPCNVDSHNLCIIGGHVKVATRLAVGRQGPSFRRLLGRGPRRSHFRGSAAQRRGVRGLPMVVPAEDAHTCRARSTRCSDRGRDGVRDVPLSLRPKLRHSGTFI